MRELVLRIQVGDVGTNCDCDIELDKVKVLHCGGGDYWVGCESGAFRPFHTPGAIARCRAKLCREIARRIAAENELDISTTYVRVW